MEQVDVGCLVVRVGPMRAGKTDFNRRKATRFADIGLKVIYINSILDKNEERNTAGGDDHSFTSHSSSNNKISEKVVKVKTHSLREIDVSDYDVICIDEGQFFEDLFETVSYWLLDLKKYIIVTSLDGSYLQRPIGEIHKLLPYAYSFKKKRAVCQLCIKENIKVNSEALHTVLVERLDESTDTVIKPGRTGDWLSVCTYHMLKHRHEK